MRTHGTLTRWNDDRGFGFITPAGGKDEVFVHISAFPRDGARPRVDELISFERENGPDGRTRAVRVMRPGRRVTRTPVAEARRPRAGIRFVSRAAILLVATLATYAYSRYQQRDAVPPEQEWPLQEEAVSLPVASAARCDGRTMCSQMTSCAEAKYFIQHCPNTQMDGDNDGVPCEAQWCH